MSYTGSQAQAGRGSSLSIGATPIPIGELKSVPVNRGKWKSVDVSNFESMSDEEILTTIRETGGTDLEFNRISSDAGQAAVEAAYQGGAIVAFTLTLPKTAAQTTKGDTYTFNAYVIASDFTIDVEKEIAGKVTLTVSGGMTLTVGT